MSRTGKPGFFYGYVIVFVAFLFEVLSWGMWATFPIFLQPMLDEFGWSRAATSGSFSLYLMVTALLGIVMGRLNDRVGPRVITTACGLFLGLGYALTSQVSAIWQLYIFYGVMLGIGQSGFVATISTVARWFLKRRALMVGIAASGAALSLGVIPTPATWLLSAYGWRNSYIIIGIITTVLIVISAQLLKRDPGQMGLSPYGADGLTEETSNLQVSGLSFRDAVRTRQFWMVCAIDFLLLVCYSAVMIHIVIHATGIGISLSAAANILVITGLVGIPGGVVLGTTGDRLNNRRALTVVCLLVALSAVWLLVADELWMLYLFGIVFGFAYGGLWALLAPVIAELFGLKSHGALLGLANFSGMTGEAIGPTMAGYIYDTTRGYQLAFVVAAAASIASFALSLLLKPIGGKDRGDKAAAG
ncbi:MAG: MFS transporter [Chloroflexi bacterium]|nr:MFS transporter [Chloroflexota bacterium]